MEQNKNIESNRLIAEFMGWKDEDDKRIDRVTYKFPNLYPQYNLEDEENTGWIGDDISEAKFHSSWDWLMPVFKKYCEEMEKIMPNSSRTRISFCVDFIAGVWANDLDVSYKYLVSGIIWYNERIKKQ